MACVQSTPVCGPSYTPACTSIGSITATATSAVGPANTGTELRTFTICCPETKTYAWETGKPTSVHFTCAAAPTEYPGIMHCRSVWDHTVVATLSNPIAVPSERVLTQTIVPGITELELAQTISMDKSAATCGPQVLTSLAPSKSSLLQDAPTTTPSTSPSSSSLSVSASASNSSPGLNNRVQARWLVASVAWTMVWGFLSHAF
ncbi:hypothetical protein PG990_010696 [Apiospora arundinis]